MRGLTYKNQLSEAGWFYSALGGRKNRLPEGKNHDTLRSWDRAPALVRLRACQNDSRLGASLGERNVGKGTGFVILPAMTGGGSMTVGRRNGASGLWSEVHNAGPLAPTDPDAPRSGKSPSAGRVKRVRQKGGLLRGGTACSRTGIRSEEKKNL